MAKRAEKLAAASGLRAALSEDDSDPGVIEEVAENDDVPGKDTLPAGFNPDDYPSDDDDEAGKDSDEGTPADDEEVETEAGDEPEPEEADEEADAAAEAQADAKAVAGKVETKTDDEDGTADKPVRLEDADLEGYVSFAGIDKPVTLKELIQGYKEREPREVYLKRSREQAELRKEAERFLEQAQAQLKARTEAADNYDAPHMFLGQAVTDWVQSGVMPKEMAEDMDALFADYIKAGKYDPNKPIQAIQQRKQANEYQANEKQRIREMASREAKEIEETEKIELSGDHRKQIADYIRSRAEQTGAVLRVWDAYLALKARGHIKVAPPAARNPAKVNKLAKAKLRAGKVGVGAPAKTPTLSPDRLSKLDHAKRVRMALAN